MRLSKIPAIALLALLALLAPDAVAATSPTSGGSQPAPIGVPGQDFVPGQLLVRFTGGGERLVELPRGVSVAEAVTALSQNGPVAYAEPNYIAHAAALTPEGWVPDDPGTGRTPGGWQAQQWNFLPCGSPCEAPDQNGTPPTPLQYQARGGIDAPLAWQILRARGRPGAAGVRVAVLDTGIAYRN